MKAPVLALLLLFFVASAAPEDKASALPLSFGGAAEAAIAASAELRAELARLSVREGVASWGLRAFFPNLGFSLGESDRLSFTGTDSFAKTASVSLEQLIWDGGRLGAARAGEAAELRLSRAAAERKRREIGEAAVAAYRSLLTARELAAIKRANAESLAEQRRVLGVEAVSGLAREDDVAEADLRVEEATLAAESASLDAEHAASILAEALGLDELPPLAEKIDAGKKAVPIGAKLAACLVDAAKAAHPELEAARLSLAVRRSQLKLAYAAWAPTVRFNGSVLLSGDRLPLTRSSWSLGFSFDLSGPFLKGSSAVSAGWEPPYDRTAGASLEASPFPDPGAALNAKAAEIELGLERAAYERKLSAMEREIDRSVRAYSLLDAKAAIALRARDLSLRRYELARLGAELGRGTRIVLMEAALDASEAEAVLVEAAAALIEGERNLERLIDAPPGTLGELARRFSEDE